LVTPKVHPTSQKLLISLPLESTQPVSGAFRLTFRLFFVTACALSSAAFATYSFIHGSRGVGYAALGAMTLA
jgi:hypothetical protein